MGYACPVCETPQADGTHLADHLAFTAVLHGGRHEAWLDEHVPDWADRDTDGLAAAVVYHADEVAHETVFDDTAGDRPDVDVGHGHGGQAAPTDLDPEARRIYEEAVEMTRKRRGAGDDGRPESDPEE